MASTIKVNNIQDQCGSAVVTKCGATTTIGAGACKSVTLDADTVTLGRCGATVQLAAGASQTGFGRTGTVNWDTTAKTAAFTAVSGNGYFVDTTSGAITVTLPASPSAGDIVAVADYAGTAGTNGITLARNGSNFEGVANDGFVNGNRNTLTVVYVDATQGWVPVNENLGSSEKNIFITATGGTITTCGDYKTHVFTSPGTFCVSAGAGPVAVADYLVIAGGGGGSGNHGGGGGAGGARVATTTICSGAPPKANPTALPISVTAYPITVGGGGAAGCNSSGSNSVFSTITSAGGGGSAPAPTSCAPGKPGGSGGGAKGEPGNGTGGTGNTPPVSPPQGSNGGGSQAPTGNAAGGGGGGACAVGGNGFRLPIPGPIPPGPGQAGAGGIGLYVPTGWIGPSSGSYGEPGPSGRYFAGGGGGGAAPAGSPGAGGLGGGGNGAGGPTNNSTAGTTNTGGGGGAGPGAVPICGKAGGSGIVIIRYKYQ